MAKKKAKTIAVIFIGAVIVAVATLTVSPAKSVIKVIFRMTGLMPAVEKVLQKTGLIVLPVHYAPILSPDRVSVRRHVVAALHKALARHDLEQAAFLNSILAQEAFQRAYRTLKAWEKVRDSETGLVPRAVHPKMAYWNAKDTAADLFPYLLLASHYLDKKNKHLWLKTLSKEREICGKMPCTIRLRPTRVEEQDSSALIFGASEYAKDGLLALAERIGRGSWFDRLEEVMQALISSAQVQTKAGKICSSSSEVNGEMLQVLSRLYWATQKDEYLQMAELIAEAYLFEIIPNNGYLPVNVWNFAKGDPESSHFRLRDHGSEIISGLTELYLLEKALGRPQAARYRKPLKKFLDVILGVGRTEDGLWHNSIDTRTQLVIDKGVVDTWGYILNAYHAFDMAEGTQSYASEIERTMRAAASRKSFPWEGQGQDGYADTIESMLYMLRWFDIPECHRWVDDEIELLFSKQFPSGFIEKWYLDGNFIRTSLLYATYKTQGLIPDPWREDVSLGAVYDNNTKELYICLTANSPWKGVLRFDLPRHRDILNLPFDYPRVNATPEWFVVEPQEIYVIIDLNTSAKAIHSGKSLAAGLSLTYDERKPPLFLKVSKMPHMH